MIRLLSEVPERKTSQAMARCILLGVSGVVSTYLIWKTVQFYASEIPLSFHLTCGLVEGVILLATLTALYRLRVSGSISPSEKPRNKAPRGRGLVKSPLVMPLHLRNQEMAWFERN